MSNNKKLRYSEAELKEFEALIIKKLKEAKESLMQLRDSLQSSNDQTYDINDYSDSAEKEHLLSLIARQERHIFHLEAALHRISNKTFGICQKTGKLIDKRRLLIVPHTTHSVEAKRRR
jgi:DnaK suppressor protein